MLPSELEPIKEDIETSTKIPVDTKILSVNLRGENIIHTAAWKNDYLSVKAVFKKYPSWLSKQVSISSAKTRVRSLSERTDSGFGRTQISN